MDDVLTVSGPLMKSAEFVGQGIRIVTIGRKATQGAEVGTAASKVIAAETNAVLAEVIGEKGGGKALAQFEEKVGGTFLKEGEATTRVVADTTEGAKDAIKVIDGTGAATTKTLYIGGQAPKLKWVANASGKPRTIKEAIQIAEKNGVRIPKDVHFWEDSALKGTLETFQTEGQTARVAGLTEDTQGYVYWDKLYNRNGKIPIGVNPAVLDSDEAIVAVFTHEISELEELRTVFSEAKGGRIQGYDFAAHTAPDIKGNYHDKAWDLADEAVLKMRAQKK